MIPIIVFTLVLFTGLYFIWRCETREKEQAKVIEMELDEHEKEISK